MNEVEQFINKVNNLAKCMEDLCLHGGCWQFHLLLKEVWPNAKPYWNDVHVITLIDSVYYDITGIVSNDGYTLMTPRSQRYAANWKPEYKITVFCHE